MKEFKHIGANVAAEFISFLKGMDGAIPYDGDYSVQVAFKLSNGRTLRFVVGDDDPCLKVDQYPGLAIVGGDQLSGPATTKATAIAAIMEELLDKELVQYEEGTGPHLSYDEYPAKILEQAEKIRAVLVKHLS